MALVKMEIKLLSGEGDFHVGKRELVGKYHTRLAAGEIGFE